MDGRISPAAAPATPSTSNAGAPQPAGSNDVTGQRGPAIAILLVLAVIGGGILLSQQDGGSAEVQPSPPTETEEAPSTVAPAGGGDETAPAAPTTEEIVPGVPANSIVEIVAYCPNGSGAGGSGTVFIDGNYILTNAHVVRPRSPDSADGCVANDIEVRMISSIDRPTTLTHRATVAAIDVRADLAILRVDPIAGTTAALRPVRLGAALFAGDDLNIIGFPEIGGQTVTVSKGVVSGFITIDGTRWIKTDASVSGGNSGGGAFARDGSLIGVPTRASSGKDGNIVDCRRIVDTNDDGWIDDDDTCVPLGGFLNLLATIEEALALAESIGLTP